MKNQFEHLYQKMCQPITFAELQGVYRELKTIGDFNDELLTAMQDKLDASRWGCLCKLIWAIPDPVPRMFSPFLCRLLDDHRHLEIMEAVADAMSTRNWRPESAAELFLFLENERSNPSHSPRGSTSETAADG